MSPIPFNKPFLTGNELDYIREAIAGGKVSGDGMFSKKCHHFLERMLGGGRAFLTTSCTDALELAALLCNIEPGDEVIAPSYTFVSTVNAFVLRGASIKFVDSLPDHPNIDHTRIEELVNPRTRAIVPVHYAGVACEMDAINDIAKRNGLRVVEDAAQAIDSYYKGRPLGTLSDLSAFSFHETKNVISGEGGFLHVNDQSLVARTEILREKGTNRSAFFRGEIDKYGWIDIGSSFLPSDIIAAFLFAQLESMQMIQGRRHAVWKNYHGRLEALERAGVVRRPIVHDYASNNAHMYYLVCESLEARTRLIDYLKQRSISAVFHYQSLHKSPYFNERHDGRSLPNADRYSDCLVRLPFYFDLAPSEVHLICDHILDCFGVGR
jgi:dTDP-4-amino-4,6-dideoxygalactose transaminase